jgi:opacity protein-like surface antigen
MKKIITVIATSLCFAFIAGATDVPKTEVFIGYSFVRFSADADIIPSRDANGGSAQFVYNFGKGFGVAFDGGAVNFGPFNHIDIDTTVAHLAAGPRYKFNQHSKFQPYVQALFGGAYATASTQIFAVPVVNPLVAVNPLIDAVSARLVASRRSFAMLIGGGLDWKVSKHMQFRPVAFDYFMTQTEPESVITDQPRTGRTIDRNNWRYSAGVNFTFGAQQ